MTVYIHALREEGDWPTSFPPPTTPEFLSTPSARRATGTGRTLHHQADHFYPRPPRGGRRGSIPRKLYGGLNFYPRPPRGGRRQSECDRLPSHSDFYPRPPRGGRRYKASKGDLVKHFYPRPPRGGRLCHTPSRRRNIIISIHALREEGDRDAAIAALFRVIFLSTPSARRATGFSEVNLEVKDISIHALREEGDCGVGCITAWMTHFYPRPPRGGRRCAG